MNLLKYLLVELQNQILIVKSVACDKKSYTSHKTIWIYDGSYALNFVVGALKTHVKPPSRHESLVKSHCATFRTTRASKCLSVGIRGCPWSPLEGVAQTSVNVRSERRLGRRSNVLGSPGSWRRPWRGRLALEVGLWPNARCSMKTCLFLSSFIYD